MARRLTFSKPAAEDLDQIWTYSDDRWGASQADAYTDALRVVAHSLLQDRNASRPVDFSPVIRRIKAEHHVIYFRGEGENILVLRILHERMDPPRHLP